MVIMQAGVELSFVRVMNVVIHNFGHLRVRKRTVSKETYLCGKRDLFMWKKRPIYVEKETC